MTILKMSFKCAIESFRYITVKKYILGSLPSPNKNGKSQIYSLWNDVFSLIIFIWTGRYNYEVRATIKLATFEIDTINERHFLWIRRSLWRCHLEDHKLIQSVYFWSLCHKITYRTKSHCYIYEFTATLLWIILCDKRLHYYGH